MKCLQGDVQQDCEGNAQNHRPRPSLVASMASGVEGSKYGDRPSPSASASSTVIGVIPPEIHAIRYRGHIADDEEEGEYNGYDNFFLGNQGAAAKIDCRHYRDDASDETPVVVVVSNKPQNLRSSYAHTSTRPRLYTRLDTTTDINEALARGFVYLVKGRGLNPDPHPNANTGVYRPPLSHSGLSAEEMLHLRAEDSLVFFPGELEGMLFWLRDRYFPSGLRLTDCEFNALVSTFDQLTLTHEHTQQQHGDHSDNGIISRNIRFSTFSACLRQSIEVLLAKRIMDDNANSVSSTPMQPEELPSDAYLPDTVIEVMRRNAVDLATARGPLAAAAATAIPAHPVSKGSKYGETLPSAETMTMDMDMDRGMSMRGFHFMHRGTELASEDIASILESDTNIGTQYARTQLSPSIHGSALSGFDESYGDDDEMFIDLEEQEVTTSDSLDDLN